VLVVVGFFELVFKVDVFDWEEELWHPSWEIVGVWEWEYDGCFLKQWWVWSQKECDVV
jgi:hypothetical protein